jgi:hypothetical protein
MKVMNGQPIDVDQVLRPAVQPVLCRAPVILGPPVSAQLLKIMKGYSLRPIWDCRRLGPARLYQPPAKIEQMVFWDSDLEGPDIVWMHGSQCRVDRLAREPLPHGCPHWSDI